MTRAFESIMIRTLLGPLVMIMQLFGLYVLIHGHYSPGGGFQAGVLLAAVFILPILVFGRGDSAEKPAGVLTLGPSGAIAMGLIGVLLYLAIGMQSLLYLHPLLDYADLPLPLDEPMRRSMGILGIEIGVTLGVAGAALSIFYSLYRDLPGEAR